MSTPAPTPNLHLQPIEANRRTWADIMNTNLRLIDAIVGTYFTVQNIQGAWQNSTSYTVGMAVVDTSSSVVYQCQVAHTSANVPTTFAEDRAAHSDYWSVYSSPARARGAWTANTSYGINDFVVSGAKYAICIETHISSSNFDTDQAAGKWSVLVDLSAVGSSVLPVPGGAADGNKAVVTNSGGSGYTIINGASFLTSILGATSIGSALLTASSGADARSTIGAQAAGSYQAASANLTTLAGVSPGALGLAILAAVDAAGCRSVLGLGNMATPNATAGILAFLVTPTSANLAAAVTDEAGTGSLVFSANPTFTGHVTVPDGTNATDAVSKQQLDAVVVPIARGYATVSGGVVTMVNASGASISRIAQGSYEFTLSSAAANTEYIPMIFIGGDANRYANEDDTFSRTTTKFRINVSGDNIGAQDPTIINFVIWPSAT